MHSGYVHRVRRITVSELLTSLIILTWVVLTHSTGDSSTPPCPSSCKCSPVEETSSASSNTMPGVSTSTVREPIMARCWIPANMVHLPCGRSWTIVHLQILTGQPQIDQATGALPSRPIGRLSYANISVSPKLFDRCASLTRLAIWERSQFTWLPQYWLRPLVKLERLFIEVPTLTALPDHFFAFLPRLSFVKISKCPQLTRISRAVFEPCPETLHTLWLDGNGLRGKLPAGVFRQCNFHSIHLSENQLNQLDWGSLSGLSELQSLHLQRNRLAGSLEQCLSLRTDMNSTALVSSPMLKKLDLSFNQIESIEGVMWSGECVRSRDIKSDRRGLCYLEELDLSHNKLKWLALDSFKGLPRLRKLNLDVNPDLFTPHGSANLALVLYAVSTINRHFQSLIIPIQNSHSDQNRPRSNGSINLCRPDETWLAQAPRYLSMTALHVKHSSCNHPLPLESELEVDKTQTVSISPLTTESLPQVNNQTHVIPNTVSHTEDEHADPILAFLRHTNRFNLLILCLGLIFVGLLIGLLPMTYFLCTPKQKVHNRKPDQSNPMMQLLLHPSSDAAFLLPGQTGQNISSSPNGSLSTPLPKRSMKNGRNGALPPIPPTRVHFAASRLPMMHGSADPIHARPLIQPAMMSPLQMDPQTCNITRSRRVNSTSNVYHRTRPQSGPTTNNHRYDRLAPRDSPIPMELHPVNRANRGAVSEAAYCPTEDTLVDGSTYSLATVTSFRGRSSAKVGTVVPTAHPTVV
ncbi:hypothetical protein D915_002936 [Fasciola hepatica]|uniref:Leucine Rich repeat-containing domain protein n=1 Tax=Fasciola hepatica TaxID=6192 RepID=A0A4E0RFK8_FASHE|nr:hypothetical protein D915_002936 [Fasciola hepatica]